MKITLEFKFEDFWVGGFWKKEKEHGQGETFERFQIWICLLPCFPIHITTQWKEVC